MPIFKEETVMERRFIAAMIGVAVLGTFAVAQERRPLSPRGVASIHVQGKWVKGPQQAFTMGGERYEGGKWIDLTFGRPLLRGRQAFTGTGADFGKATLAGTPVWRAGADVTTRLKTDLPLVIGGKTIPPGEYSIYIDFKGPTDWQFIVSNWGALQKFGNSTPDALWGSFDYTPAKDVVRTPMTVGTLPYRLEQLDWEFTDVTDTSARMAVMWDRTMASVPFTIGQ
jgi:hypothetical protein